MTTSSNIIPSLRQHILVAVIGIYLILIILGAWTQFPYNLSNGTKDFFYTLMDYSGSNNDFSYFAPAVSSQLKTDFIRVTSQENESILTFEANNKEINLRINSLIASAMKKAVLQDICARSWAAFLIGSLPNTKQIIVRTQVYNVPSMKEYRSGLRPHWTPVYQSSFERFP